MKPCRETCHLDPRKCPHAVEKEEGDSYYSGLPIRTYWAGEDECPILIAEAVHKSNMDDYLYDIAYGLGLR